MDHLRLHLSLSPSSRRLGLSLAEDLRSIGSPAVQMSSSHVAHGRHELIVTLTSPSPAATPDLIRCWVAQLLAAEEGPHHRLGGCKAPRAAQVGAHVRNHAVGGPSRGDATEDATSELRGHSQRERVVASLMRRPTSAGGQHLVGRARLAR
jgi:hypothetical protein